MSKRFLGSIEVDALAQAVKDKHSSITVANNTKRYANIVIWENDTPDQYGNTHSIQLQSAKDSQDPKIYIGRAKPPQQQGAPVTVVNRPDTNSDLPF